ncbi:MAG: phosphomannomutase [Haloarculaceae archaeon]
MELFGTAGIRGPVDETVTPELALAVGRAVGRDATEVVLGRDGRVTGPGLAAALEAGITSAGADVRRLGVVPTAALAFAARGRRGIMVTASHNPPEDNGLKCFVDGREYDRESERRVEARVDERDSVVPWSDWGTRREGSVLDAYRGAIRQYAAGHGARAEGLVVAVDCGNGTGSLATPQVLSDPGAEVQALNANVDGHFPGRQSKPTPESIRDLRDFVAAGPAELGFAHDGDADRIVVVGPDGEVVHEDTVLAVLAEHFVRRAATPDPVVVTTPNASGRIDERVAAAGGRVERVRLGALHEGTTRVRSRGSEGTAVVFAAEPWKHVHPDLGPWIDGIASAAVLTRLVGETSLRELTEPVDERPYRKVSVDCPDEAKGAAMTTLEETLPEAYPDASVETEYGVRLSLPDGGWTLVRPSGTESYLRIYAESERVDDLVVTVRGLVEDAVDEARAAA